MTNQTINKNEIKKNNMSYTPDVTMFPYFKKSSIEQLEEENNDLKKKSDAKSDIIRNMMDVIIRNADIDDGFYIGREWGHKYIDQWNKIVTEELEQAVKDINYMDKFSIETDGYQFDFRPPEEEDCMELFCKKHDITKEEFLKCVEESCDYDIKDFIKE